MKSVKSLLAVALLATSPLHATRPVPQPVKAAQAHPAAAPEDCPVRKRFVTRHVARLGGAVLPYTAIAGETCLYDAQGEATAKIWSFSYLKDGAAARPVLFVFNGGPGSSSLWLHMGAIGPRRVVLDSEVNPSNVPPFEVADNPNSLLDVADLVFIDPIGTGWSRAIGRGTPKDFWGVDVDADATAQFIETWLTEHRRWGSPKFVMGESYGSTRAAILPRALIGGPLYVGRMRGITLNGIILLGTTLDARDAKGAVVATGADALALPAEADTAWYHRRIDRRGLSLERFHQNVLAFAKGDYAAALQQAAAGRLASDARARIVARLTEFTGLPPATFATSLALPVTTFANLLLADRNEQVGAYDSRYTLPLLGSGGDPVADDPAMGRYVPGFVAAFHDMAANDLGIDLDRPYGAIVWKDLLASWDWKRSVVPQDQSFAVDLAVAMRRTPKLRLLVASGYFDLVTGSAAAEQAIAQAGLPADRVTLRRYASGHMLYLGDTGPAFSADVRALIRQASQ